jgi:hypothetical protein
MRFIGFKTGEREMITEVNTVLILVATLVLMAVISLAVILLVRRRVGHRVVESERESAINRIEAVYQWNGRSETG